MESMEDRLIGELETAKRQLSSVKMQIQNVAHDFGVNIEDDAYGMTPGLGTQNAALQMAILGTKYRDLQRLIETLTFINCGRIDS